MNEQEKNSHADLSRLYRDAAQPEPSAAIDAAILAAAHSAVDVRAPGKPAKNSMQRWRLPFALAATVVLSVAVTTMVRDELPPGAVALPMPDTATSSSVAESAGANRSKSAPESMQAEPAAKPAYEPAPTKRENAQADARASAPMQAREREDAPAVFASPAAPALQASPAAQGAFAADAAAPSRSNTEDKAVSVLAAPRSLDKRAFSSSLREEAQAGASVASEKSPEAWIADIRALKRAGLTTEAAGKLVEFRKRFPDYKLPDDLK